MEHGQAGGSQKAAAACSNSPKGNGVSHASNSAAGSFPRRGGRGGRPSVAPTSQRQELTAEEKAAFSADWKQLEQEDLSSADYYFNSYAHFSIHEEMIKDTVRTGSYQRAIMDNEHLFRGKVVLDVGSGTGILSLFAARAGAKHVYGVECSEIVRIARKIAAANGLDDRVTFVEGKAEEITLPVEKVDIIVSEWMGYFLLYESMLDTVIYCRDKWLAEDGLMFPDRAHLYLAAIEDADYKEEKIGYWESVYGLDFTCVKKCIMEEPIVDTVDENAVATNSCCVLEIDLATCTPADLDFCAGYTLHLRRKDFLHAFVAWFDVVFSKCHKPVILNTSPHNRYTHWKQTVFYMEHVLVGEVGDTVKGMIAVKKNKKNPRDLDIKISYEFQNRHTVKPIANTQFYRLSCQPLTGFSFGAANSGAPSQKLSSGLRGLATAAAARQRALSRLWGGQAEAALEDVKTARAACEAPDGGRQQAASAARLLASAVIKRLLELTFRLYP
ncbi:hypothetical protein Efla_002817 [Eimeria flavescens]